MSWHQALNEFWSSAGTGQDSLKDRFDFDLNRALSWMASQLVLIDLESLDETPGKLILLESRDGYEALNQINRITEEFNRMAGDTLYYENYGETTIRLLNTAEFPSTLFGEWYSGFPVTYYTLIEPFIILANDIEPIKELINGGT